MNLLYIYPAAKILYRRTGAYEKTPQCVALQGCWLLYDFSRIDADLLLVAAFAFEADNTVFHCEKRIVSAASDIQTRMDMCSALFNKNIACKNKLTVCTLNAKTL